MRLLKSRGGAAKARDTVASPASKAKERVANPLSVAVGSVLSLASVVLTKRSAVSVAIKLVLPDIRLPFKLALSLNVAKRHSQFLEEEGHESCNVDAVIIRTPKKQGPAAIVLGARKQITRQVRLFDFVFRIWLRRSHLET